MHRETIELCWLILKQYIKNSDLQNAADHLVNEIVDTGIDDIEIPKLAAADRYLKSALVDYIDEDNDSEEWEN